MRTRRETLKRPLLISLAVLAFVAISGLLARWLSVENAERDADLALIQAQVQGDGSAMLGQLSGCRQHAACLRQVQANLANPRLRRRGRVKILLINSPTAYSVTGASGRTRVAWTVIGTLPVVQCVTVRRTGNPVTGISVSLLAISAPIDNEGTC